MATTAFCYSAKAELAQGGHCFLATQSAMTATANTTTAVTGIAPSTAPLAVGMAVTGANVAANTVLAQITGAATATLSVATTGANSTLTFTGDVFKMLLIKTSPSLTYSGTQTNVGTPGTGTPSVTNVGTDETSGTGYTSGGFALTNISPAVGTTAGFWSFTTNPSWTSASFSTTAGIIYNSSVRIGHANGVAANASGSAVNRSISVHDFGGTQTVASGTFTVVLPTNAQGTAILQIS